MRFLDVASRVVWSAPAAMRALAVSVRPLRKERARGVRLWQDAGLSISDGNMERRYFRTEREAGYSAWDRMLAWRERWPKAMLVRSLGWRLEMTLTSLLEPGADGLIQPAVRLR